MNSNFNWHKLLKVLLFGLLAVVAVLYIVLPLLNNVGMRVGDLLIAAIGKYPFGAFIVACIFGLIIWGARQKPPQTPIVGKDPKPTMNDYQTIAKTIFVVVKNIGETFGFAPVRGYTDIYVDEADRILQWENVWGMKFKLLKQRCTNSIDLALALQAFQQEVDSVLENYNPSKLSKIKYPYGGTLKSIIQIADMDDGNAYVYLYAVLVTSDTYFKQKAENERNDVAKTVADTEDNDF